MTPSVLSIVCCSRTPALLGAAAVPLALLAACGAGGPGEEQRATPPAFSGTSPVMGQPADPGALASTPATSGGNSSAPGAQAATQPQGTMEGSSNNLPIQQTSNASQNNGAAVPPADDSTGATDNANSEAAGTPSDPSEVPDGAGGAPFMMPQDMTPNTAGSPTQPVEDNSAVGASNCGGDLLLCDDFEGVANGNSPDPALWDYIVAYNPTQGQTDAVQVTTEQAHSGSQSVFVSGANGRTGMIGSVPARNYYVRAWMFADAAPLGPVLAGFGSDGNNEVRFRIWNNSWATINSTVQDDLVPGPARAGNCTDCAVVPARQWFCMEYFVNDSAQEATLWIDGQQAAVLSGSWPNMPDEAQVFLGVMRIQDGADIYVDDVAASPNRIGCE